MTVMVGLAALGLLVVLGVVLWAALRSDDENEDE